jgi:hypothetical protein
MGALVDPWLGEGQAAFYRQIAQADERFTNEINQDTAISVFPP